MTATAPRSRVSLKWKMLALLGLALLVVNGGLLSFQIYEREQALEAARASERAQHLRALERLLESSATRLQRIGTIVPNLVDALDQSEALQQQWAVLQLELDLLVLGLLDSDGSWLLTGRSDVAERPPAELEERVRVALREERPDTFLICQTYCAQYALVPSLGPQGRQRLMVLATRMADVVLEFSTLTGADIALYGRRADSPGLRLAALSDAPRNRERLQRLIAEHGLAPLQQGRALPPPDTGFRASSTPWSRFGGVGEGYVVIVEDERDRLAHAAAELRQTLLSSLTALAVTLVLGYVILNRPMNQLRRLARALPLLADRAYDPARALIGHEHRHRRWPTEIDLLEGLAVSLADQLEALELTVSRRNKALAENVAELRRSQNLNEKILSTAPIAILMLSGEGRIMRVNRFTGHLLGYSESELRRMNFLDLLDDPRQSREAAHIFVDLISGRRSTHEHSGPVRCVDASAEQMTWLHSRVLAQEGVFILALGLPERAQPAESSSARSA